MSLRHLLLIPLLASTGFSSASRQTTETETRAIQLAYESDTRGYYLPCG